MASPKSVQYKALGRLAIMPAAPIKSYISSQISAWSCRSPNGGRHGYADLANAPRCVCRATCSKERTADFWSRLRHCPLARVFAGPGKLPHFLRRIFCTPIFSIGRRRCPECRVHVISVFFRLLCLLLNPNRKWFCKDTGAFFAFYRGKSIGTLAESNGTSLILHQKLNVV